MKLLILYNKHFAERKHAKDGKLLFLSRLFQANKFFQKKLMFQNIELLHKFGICITNEKLIALPKLRFNLFSTYVRFTHSIDILLKMFSLMKIKVKELNKSAKVSLITSSDNYHSHMKNLRKTSIVCTMCK